MKETQFGHSVPRLGLFQPTPSKRLHSAHLLSSDWLHIKTPARHTFPARFFFTFLLARLSSNIPRLTSCCQPCLPLTCLIPDWRRLQHLLCVCCTAVGSQTHPFPADWSQGLELYNLWTFLLEVVPAGKYPKKGDHLALTQIRTCFLQLVTKAAVRLRWGD